MTATTDKMVIAPKWWSRPDTKNVFAKLYAEQLGISVMPLLTVMPKRKPVTIPENIDRNKPFTAERAAASLGITTEQFMAHVKDGAIQYINVGRGKKRPRYRFDPADLDSFKMSRTTMESSPCRSSSRKSPSRTIGTASRSSVVDFSALRAARMKRTPSGSKR